MSANNALLTHKAGASHMCGRHGVLLQVRAFEHALRVLSHWFTPELLSRITVSSVDGYQGREADVVLFSAVRWDRACGLCTSRAAAVFWALYLQLLIGIQAHHCAGFKLLALHHCGSQSHDAQSALLLLALAALSRPAVLLLGGCARCSMPQIIEGSTCIAAVAEPG